MKPNNEHIFTSETGFAFIAPPPPEDKRPSTCVGCSAYETVCQQNIKILESMVDFSEKLSV